VKTKYSVVLIFSFFRHVHVFRFQFLTEHNSDEEWKLDVICDALSQRHPGEKYIVLPDYNDKVNLMILSNNI